MTIQEKQERKNRRCERRRAKNHLNMNKIKEYMDEGLAIRQARMLDKRGYFYDDGGRLKQICSWSGFCDHPCNGDC